MNLRAPRRDFTGFNRRWDDFLTWDAALLRADVSPEMVAHIQKRKLSKN
jgi:hypothetical protein